jgi:hypothetical protein
MISKQLSSGKICLLHRVRGAGIPRYFVLSVNRKEGEPNEEDRKELFAWGVYVAERLSMNHLGDKEAYTLFYSGYSARREKGWHLHIVLLGNRWRKAWLYFVLCGKNLTQALSVRKDDAPRTR